jgi:hypothetical protein
VRVGLVSLVRISVRAYVTFTIQGYPQSCKELPRVNYGIDPESMWFWPVPGGRLFPAIHQAVKQAAEVISGSPG